MAVVTDNAGSKEAAKAGDAVNTPQPAWLRALFDAVDARDLDGFLAHLHDEATFRFGNADAVTGKRAIGEVVGGFFQSIASVQHSITGVWQGDGSLCCHGQARYERHDGSELTAPFANVFYLATDGRIRDYLIHVDLSSLYR